MPKRTDLNDHALDNVDADDGVYLDPDLPEDKFVENLMQAVHKSEQYWNSRDGFDLKETRKENIQWWLPEHYDDIELYTHEQEYVDPRIFVSTETIVSTAAGRLPYPETFPASDSITSINLARDLQKGLHAWAEKMHLLDIFRGQVRHTILQRGGTAKLEFDPMRGKDGDIVPVLVDPADLVVDKAARRWSNPKFIAHKQTKTVEEWIAKFPHAKSKILKAMNMTRGVKTQMAKPAEGHEVWFTAYKKGKPEEYVAWVIKDKTIAKARHPHWIHDDEKMGDGDANILDYPEKPFFTVNHLSLGKYYYDDTSLVEQSASLQAVLEKRGRQIVQNADDASGGLVLNSEMVEKDDASELTGDPQEKIMVAGDVRAAAARIAPALLPSYVIQDKFDARNEIDNVFATHAPSRGEESGSKTLGQDVLQSNQDMTRHDDLIRSVEFMATRFYKYVVQMMKVHYTEEHLFRMSGENGTFNFISLKNDRIEDGVDVQVQSGSTLPIDRVSLRAQTLQLAEQGLVDPLTLYETLQFPDPQKMVERLIKYQTAPERFSQAYKEEDFEREAFTNIQIINSGEFEPKEVKEPSEDYLEYYRNFIMSGEFQDLPGEIKQKHLVHIQEVAGKLQKMMELQQSQMPTDQENADAERAAAQQAVVAPPPQQQAMQARTEAPPTI